MLIIIVNLSNKTRKLNYSFFFGGGVGVEWSGVTQKKTFESKTLAHFGLQNNMRTFPWRSTF